MTSDIYFNINTQLYDNMYYIYIQFNELFIKVYKDGY